MARYSLGSTILSNPLESFESTYAKQEVQFTLDDGTKIGGLFFKKQNPNPVPLIIVNFGALADRWYNTSRKFICEIVLSGKIDANILVVDSVSSAGFYVLNHTLSLGGYDEGQVLMGVAKSLRAHPLVNFSSLHLMGVSLGGLATTHAMILDAKSQTHYFKSAINFSAVLNQRVSTEQVVASFGHPLVGSSGETLGAAGKLVLYAGVPHFNRVLKSRGVNDFKLQFGHIGDQLYDLFQKRLNEKYQGMSVESYEQWSSGLTQDIDLVRVPFTFIHAEDDMVIPYSDFQKFADRERCNPFTRKRYVTSPVSQFKIG